MPTTAQRGPVAPGQGGLLRTKLGVPPLRGGVVARTELLDTLDRGLGGRLILASAPAGFGKTTLVSHWLAERDVRAGWLSLDAGDNDPARFCRYLLAAAEPLLEGDDAAVRGLLAEPQLATGAVAAVLVNGLAALPHPGLLVLDDLHVITEPAVYELIASLVEHLPPPARVVLLSRADPPLQLARLRARGELLEIRVDRLRFSAPEAGAFFAGTMGLRLDEADVAALTERTEGWPAGLQLAALSLEGRSDAGQFIAAFTGSHRFVLDYLLEEVLERQPPDVQRFLLETSILERLSVELCAAVTARGGDGDGDGGESHLRRLERSNLFVVPLDDERRWYRYHHLFADCLRARLGRSDPALPATLHRRAAEWLAANGSQEDAVEHALLAADPAYAAGLVESVAFDVLARSEFATVRRWLDALPAEEVERSPSLCVYCGWVFLEAFLADRARRWLDRPADADLPAHLRLLRAALQARLRWLHGAPGEARTLVGEDLLDAVLADESAIPNAPIRAYLVLYASAQLAEALRLQGQLRRAAQTYRDALRRSGDIAPDMRLMAARSFAELGLGRLLYELDDLAAAELHLANGIDMARRAGNDQYAAWGAMFLPPVRQAQGRGAEARALVDEAEKSARRRGVNAEVVWCAALRARLARAQGDLAAVAAWVGDHRASVERAPDAPLGYIEAFAEATYARSLLALGRAGEARGLVERLLTRASAAGQTRHVVELLILGALAAQAEGDTARAIASLDRALTLAEPEGYVRTFAGEGEALADLLAQGRWSNVSATYVQRLLAAARRSGTQPTPAPAVSTSGAPSQTEESPFVERLTPRELEVLHLIAAGRSNRQIAAALVITLNTAKTHVHAVCGKLGAENRAHAAARARQLGLLP
ncbi:MAG TPA: LuxR C-terminal-related transcriptional regulator [Chloroflexota bacterium]|nr:LuxR C-terminal-related transcriptional regulator [Chloroflexota bacterium]